MKPRGVNRSNTRTWRRAVNTTGQHQFAEEAHSFRWMRGCCGIQSQSSRQSVSESSGLPFRFCHNSRSASRLNSGRASGRNSWTCGGGWWRVLQLFWWLSNTLRNHFCQGALLCCAQFVAGLRIIVLGSNYFHVRTSRECCKSCTIIPPTLGLVSRRKSVCNLTPPLELLCSNTTLRRIAGNTFAIILEMGEYCCTSGPLGGGSGRSGDEKEEGAFLYSTDGYRFTRTKRRSGGIWLMIKRKCNSGTVDTISIPQTDWRNGFGGIEMNGRIWSGTVKDLKWRQSQVKWLFNNYSDDDLEVFNF